jgi:hypothetical protein
MWQAIKATSAKYFPGYRYYHVTKNLGPEGRIHATGVYYDNIPITVAAGDTVFDLRPDGNIITNPYAEHHATQAFMPINWFTGKNQRSDKSVFDPANDDYIVTGSQSWRIFNIIGVGGACGTYFFVLRRDEIVA